MIREALGYLEIGAALVAAALWYLFPTIGLWPLVVGLAPWVIGLAGQRLGAWDYRPRTALDPALLLFLATSSVGLWATYQRDVILARMPFYMAVGWQKYGLLLAAICLCLALARLPNARAVWIATAGLTCAGAAAGLYFLLTNDFTAAPAKFALLGRIGSALQAVRPAVPLHPVGPNQVGTVTAMMLPAGLQLALAGWRERRRPAGWLALAIAAVCLPIIAAGLLLSTSRGAWLALAVALMIWAAWAASSKVPALLPRRADRLLLPAFALLVALLVLRPALITLIQGFMGEGINRLELMRLSTLLVRDYPFTGIGLGTYPLVFSTYVLLIHVGFIGSAHNLYIDLAAEQGVGGLLAFLAIVAVTARLAWVVSGRSSASRPAGGRTVTLPLAGAVAMLIVMLLHGLVDDPIYSRRASLIFLLVPMGLIAGLWRISRQQTPADRLEEAGAPASRSAQVARIFGAGAVIAIAILAAFLARQPLQAAWHANLAALDQTRAELTVYDPARYNLLSLNAVRRQIDVAGTETQFRRALAIAPDNVTAAQRLAMLAYARGDYAASLALLERLAARGASDHITRLLLADALVADGQVTRAIQAIAGLPFAKGRMIGLAEEFTALGDAQRAAWARAAAAQIPE